MLSFLNDYRGLSFGTVLLRVALACVFGAVIGLERSYRNRPAGFRTHILVCLGSCVAAATGLYLTLVMKLPSDISRISAQVISGLGFIVAGTIIVTRKSTIKGLTTAAGLWTSGIIGLAVGSGYYELGLLGTMMVLLAETVFGTLGLHIRHQPDFQVEILYNEKNSLDSVLRYCKDNRLDIVNLRIRSNDSDARASYTAEVRLRGMVKAEHLIDHVHQMPGIVSAMAM